MIQEKLVITHNGYAAKEEVSTSVYLQAEWQPNTSVQLLHVAQS